MKTRSTHLLFLVAVTLGLWAACASDPPPKKEPPRCPRLERDTEEVVEEVLCAQKDSDGDSVDDAVDLCPEAKETPNGTFDGDGCPDPDQDHDLVLDFDDACPDQAGIPPNGCPEKDQDGDGLPDHLDGCPARAEDLDGEDDADGCPEGERKLAEGERLEVWEARDVEMKKGKDQPTEAGARTLALLTDGAAERVGTVVKVRIRGTAGMRETRRRRAPELAAQRAQAVRSVFLATGLPPSRVEVETELIKGKEAKKPGVVHVEIEVAVKAGEVPGAASGSVDGGAPPGGSSSGDSTDSSSGDSSSSDSSSSDSSMSAPPSGRADAGADPF